jgi:hypothetical protein
LIEQIEQEANELEIEIMAIDKLRKKILELSTEIQALSLECEQRIISLEARYEDPEPPKKRGRPKKVSAD